MGKVKDLLKKTFKIHSQSGVTPLKSLAYVGSMYHGYFIPLHFLQKGAVCYCVGAGNDISFDTELKTQYNADIYIFDPTPASKDHFNELKDAVLKNTATPSVHGDPGYQYKINTEQLNEIKFVEEGVWSEKTSLKFYDPGIEDYVSQSAFLFKDSKKFVEFPVDTVSNFMKRFGHSSVDILKLEIEGAEYEVLDRMLKDKADVKVILVEFDEVFHVKGVAHRFRIKKACDDLKKAGYMLVHSTSLLKRTFVRKDVYTALKEKELNNK